MSDLEFMEPEDAELDYPESFNLARELHDNYIERHNGIKSILVSGSWGTGKSTVRKILIGKIRKDKSRIRDVVGFNAMQLEESSQVTSSFYLNLARYYENKRNKNVRNKFNAVSYLKKESNANNISINLIIQIILIGLVTYLLTKISKIGWLNDVLSPEYQRYTFHVDDPALCYKILLLIFIMCVIYYFRNNLLQFIVAQMPRISHVEILRKINLNNVPLIIIVDEIDRLKPESAKYLLDELLILRECLSYNKKNKLTIFLFCDVKSITIEGNKSTSYLYLQKHFEYKHHVYFSSIISFIRENLEDKYDLSYKSMDKLNKFYQWIADHNKSHREIERLFNNLFNTITDDKIYNLVNNYLLYGNSETLKQVLHSDSSNENKILVLFKIISIYNFTKYDYQNRYKSDSDNQESNDTPINISVLPLINELIFSARSDIIFKKVKELNYIEFELIFNKYSEIIKHTDLFINLIKNTILLNFELYISKQVPLNSVKKELEEKVKILGESGLMTDYLNVINDCNSLDELGIQIENYIKELSELKQNRISAIKLINVYRKILDYAFSGTKHSDLDASIDDITDDEGQFVSFFDTDFREIAKIIHQETQFYKNYIDIKFNDINTNEIIESISLFIDKELSLREM